MRHRRRWAGVLLVVLILAGSFTPPFRAAMNFPERVAIPAGDSVQIRLGLPFAVRVEADRSGMIQVNGLALGDRAMTIVAQALSLRPLATGQVTLDLKLFGIIPFRQLTVDIVPPLRVYPGGQSIGVLLRTDGVLVVGHAPVRGADGQIHDPARDAGLAVGDRIVRLDGRPVENVEQVAERIHRAGDAGRAIDLEVVRNGRRFQTRVSPVYDREHGRYLIGVWIRDSSAGVGTLTFYEPQTGIYGALGHTVLDADTGEPLPVAGGRIVPADVVEVNRGAQGRPGEKIGVFEATSPTLGDVRRNTPYGLVGRLSVSLGHPLFEEPIPVGLASRVQPGPAEILTVVEGQRLQRFTVEIERILGNHAGGKNMIVHVTDPDLLAVTGGIVQGMSGSPILQNGRLVGAITHVFVNDPTRGYGVFIEWMIRESGLLDHAWQAQAG
ncbi:MAG TPA: SpoIVB peptidase [Bacillota bacterium]